MLQVVHKEELTGLAHLPRGLPSPSLETAAAW